MDEYAITFARSARKELQSLAVSVIRKILPRIEALARQPRPLNCRKLQGEENLWRIRVGDYRIIYSINDAERIVDIIAIRHRRAAYR
jgi:mRNA interferase RelE/StbE